MDVTYEHYLDKISRSHNKSNWRVRHMIRSINLSISGYRLLAMKSGGYIREFSNKQANYLDNRLRVALGAER